MKKQTRIGLMVLVTIVLLLALTLPGMAKKEEPYRCYIRTLLVSNGGSYDPDYVFYGDLDAYWEDGTLYNFCTGTVPFGDQLDFIFGWRFATFEESCEYWDEDVECTKNTLAIEGQEGYDVFDPETGVIHNSDYVSYTIHKNGKFLFYKESTP